MWTFYCQNREYILVDFASKMRRFKSRPAKNAVIKTIRAAKISKRITAEIRKMHVNSE